MQLSCTELPDTKALCLEKWDSESPDSSLPGSKPKSQLLLTHPQLHQDTQQSGWYILTTQQACVLSCIQLFVSPWTVAHQAPLSVEFFRQEYWSGLPFRLPGDLLHPETKPTSFESPALASGFFTTVPPGKPPYQYLILAQRPFLISLIINIRK